MADLQVEGEELVLHLSGMEKLEAVHGDLRVPLSAVRTIEVLDDAHEPADHGLKFGTRIFGVTEVGTFRGRGKKLFAAVHHDTPRGIRIDFDGTDYYTWIVGCSDPEATKARIESR